jgi:DnaJ-class molecular chaperone
MPIFLQSGHGDLYVEYNVVLPVELNANLRRSEFSCVTLSLAVDTILTGVV